MAALCVKKTMMPHDSSDEKTVAASKMSSDAQVLKNIEELLEWLQDMNWPIFIEVADRFSPLVNELVFHIGKILESSDSIWKANIIGHLNRSLDRLNFSATVFSYWK